MSVDAASAACCCGGGQGGIDCPEWIACAPASILFSYARSDSTVRRWPTGGQYLDTLGFTAAGTLSRGMDGVFRGTIVCDARQDWQYESAANGIAWEEDPQCFGNPWGCPNLDCCATRLEAYDSFVYDQFTLSVTIRCVPAVAGFPASIEMVFDAEDAIVDWTSTRTTVFCAPPDVPNPTVAEGQQSAQSVFEGFTGLQQAIALPRECLPTNFFDQYNIDETVVERFPQMSDLICFRRTFTPPYFQIVGSCVSEDGTQTNCGDMVQTSRTIRVVTFG